MSTRSDLTLFQAAKRWQLTADGVRARARALGVTLTDTWPADFISAGDQYHLKMQAMHNTTADRDLSLIRQDLAAIKELLTELIEQQKTTTTRKRTAK